MKGRNELRLNTATLIEALQEYFDRRITGAKQKVTSIDKCTNCPADSTYLVNVEEVEAEPEPSLEANALVALRKINEMITGDLQWSGDALRKGIGEAIDVARGEGRNE